METIKTRRMVQDQKKVKKQNSGMLVKKVVKKHGEPLDVIQDKLIQEVYRLLNQPFIRN